MKVSLNLMKSYASDEQYWQLPVDELVAKIGRQLGAVEEVIDTRGKYQGIKVVEITEAVPHPDADKLNVYQAYDGQAHFQVVSGDTSLNIGDKVAWLAPGTTVPSSWGTNDPFVLEVRPLRGHMSHGMFGSGKELDMNDDHSGVLKLDTDAPAGTPLADAYQLDDVIIDIENKMFTHRPDCFGHLGIAREIAGIQGIPFESPDWYSDDVPLPEPESSELKVDIKNDIPELAPRFVAVPMANVTVGPSPLWLQSFLHRLGIRPINTIVDITNYYMVLTGQPLHAYDYDKVKALTPQASHATLTVRFPQQGEKILLLNGKEIEPHAKAMMVASGDTLVCVGGVMGGASTEIDEHTKNIILEAATWNMYSIRRTSMLHGLFTDAVTRFSKGQSPLQNAVVIAKAANEIKELVGAHVAGKPADDMRRTQSTHPVVVAADFINARLGSALSTPDIATVLGNVEFAAEEHGNELLVKAPFWRTDIDIAEDIVEEVGRLCGFDSLPHELPIRDARAPKTNRMELFKDEVRGVLASAGGNELQTYSFVPATLLEHAGQQKQHAFGLRNALSPELQHYRLSLTPSILEKVHPNIKAGFTEHALFEIGKIHIKGDEDCDGLPREYQTLAFAYANKQQTSGAAYYRALAYLGYFLQAVHVNNYEIVPADTQPQWEIGRQIFAPFEPKRSGFILINGEFGGFIGEYNAKVRKALKLPATCAGFEIDLERALKHRRATTYQSILKFPATEQDVCFRVGTDAMYSSLRQLVTNALTQDKRLRVNVQPLDIYQRQDDPAHKQITFRISLQHHDRTLTTSEVNDMLDKVVQEAAATLGAERV